MESSISERHSLKLEDSANLRSPSSIAALAILCALSAQQWFSTRSAQLSSVVDSGELGLACKPQAFSQLITTVTRS